MLNIDKISSNNSVVAQEQLFTELTLEEGAVIEGGVFYSLGNKAGFTVPYTINGESDSLFFNDEKEYDFEEAPIVSFDQKIGPGYQPVSFQLREGINNFDTRRGNLILPGATRVRNPWGGIPPATATSAALDV